MKRAPITEEQSRQIVDMREDSGLSCPQIARRLGLHHGAVSWHLLKLGIEKGGKPPRGYKPKQQQDFMRNGQLVRGFTPDDDDLLVRMDIEGLGHSEMARRLGRKPNSIKGRLYTLARREERLEAANDNEPRIQAA